MRQATLARLPTGHLVGYGLIALALAAAIVAPLAMQAAGVPPYWTHISIVAIYYAVLASSWSLLAGYAGQFSFGHMAFMAVGAYTSGILGRFLGLGVVPGIVLGTLMAGVFGLIVGVLCLRLRRTYLALFTIAYAEILRLVFAVERQWTNGPDGLEFKPLFAATTSKIPPYYAHLALLVGSLIFMSWLASSRFGLFLRSIREDEEAAAAMGVHVVRYKVLVFIITSMIAGLAGAMQWHYVGLIAPNSILIREMSIVITMAVIGGIENLFTAAVGAIIIWYTFELLRGFNFTLVLFGHTFEIMGITWRWVVFGTLLMVTLRFFQNGLFYPVLQYLFRRGVAAETVARRQLEPGGEQAS